MKTKTIRQRMLIKASPHDVYETLMDSRKHSRLIGAPASLSRKEGGKFSAYDGDVSGVNLELKPDQKIVQQWRINTDGWPEGHYSKAKFTIEEVDGGTQLTFTQTGVPEQSYDDIRQGWYDYYWTPMQQKFQRATKDH